MRERVVRNKKNCDISSTERDSINITSTNTRKILNLRNKTDRWQKNRQPNITKNNNNNNSNNDKIRIPLFGWDHQGGGGDDDGSEKRRPLNERTVSSVALHFCPLRLATE